MKFNSMEDLLVWPDHTQCCRYELEEMNHMSDDYLVVPYGSEFYPDEDSVIESHRAERLMLELDKVKGNDESIH